MGLKGLRLCLTRPRIWKPIVRIAKRKLPEDALLHAYCAVDGAYTDCYSIDVAGFVSLHQYVAAFYTTWLFRIERIILKYMVSRPSTDEQAQDVANGFIDQFAAWSVEKRSRDQLLMCDMAGRTRSWFMVETVEERSRLYFGSAVVPARSTKGQKRTLGFIFSALLGFHKLYSRALLLTAARRLNSRS